MQELRATGTLEKVTGSLKEEESKYFLLWIAVWIVALAVLLPTLG